jgi:hypothetical protein
VRSTRRRSLAAVLVSGAIVMSSCGGDSGPGDTGPTDPQAPVTAAPDPTDPADPTVTTITTVGPDTTTAPDDQGADDVEEPDAGGDDGDTAGSEPPAAEAPEILRFSAPVVGGGELDLAAYGDRPVLLWFWAPF